MAVQKTNGKRFLCAVMAVLLLFGSLFPTVRAADVHSHEVDGRSATFEPLRDGVNTISASGSYYLDSNLALTGSLTISGAGTVVDLCLNGHMLEGTGTSGTIILVEDGAVLNICDCYDPATHVGEEYAHSYPNRMENREIIDITGGLISAPWSKSMYGIKVSGGGTLNFYGGTVGGCGMTNASNVPLGNGGGINLDAGTVNIYSGAAVRDNVAANGGGIYVKNGRTNAHNIVNIYGGSIINNTAATAGGGIWLGAQTELHQSGGTISGNDQSRIATTQSYGGGGIFMNAYSGFVMTGGSVTKNTAASRCGGIFVNPPNVPDERVNPMCGLWLSGDAVIDGNTYNGAASNLCLYYRTATTSAGPVILAGPMGNNAKVGISYTIPTLSDLYTVVKGDDAYNGGVIQYEDYDKFFSDSADRVLTQNGDNEIAVGAGRVHSICGAVCNHETKHPSANYQPLRAGFTGGNLPAGNYYLQENVALTSPIVVSGSGTTVNFCLNGYELRNTTGRVFSVSDGAQLNLSDCYASDTHTGDAYTHTYSNPRTRVEVTVHGGLIAGRELVTVRSGGIDVTGATLNLYGGTIGGASGMGGVCVMRGGTFNMVGGSINDCWNTGSGGGVYADGTSSFNMSGGEIRSNRAGSYGGGIYAQSGFKLSGNVRITDNIVNMAEENVYLPGGIKIDITGAVSGMVGVTMETPGVFTTGGAAPYAASFRADVPVGTFADVEGSELTLTGYGIRKQPTSDDPTVHMKSPESVKEYQWYKTDEKVLTPSDVTGGGSYDGTNWTYTGVNSGETVDCFPIELHEGDTIVIKPSGSIGGAYLMQSVTLDGEEVLERAVACERPDEDGAYVLTAMTDGNYVLRLTAADTQVRFGASLFRCGDADTVQTGATYIGQPGWRICRIEYIDGVSVFYSRPFNAVWQHSHASCGASCSHGGAHGAQTFTPAANNLAGALIVGDTLSNFRLASGSYYLAADVVTGQSLVIPSGANVNLCLNGHNLTCTSGSVIRVENGGQLTLCDCMGGGKITGTSAVNGGGLYIAGTAYLYGGTLTGSTAAGRGGGAYVSGRLVMENGAVGSNTASSGGGIYLDGGGLELSGSVSVFGNKDATGNANNVYLSSGTVIELTEAFASDSSVGITMQRAGVFTRGAKSEHVQCFVSDNEAGYVSESESGEMTLRSCAFLKQPTGDDPSVEVSDPENASFRWHSASGIAVSAGNASAASNASYDVGSGLWTSSRLGAFFEIHLEKGQILRVTPEAALSDGTVFQTDSGGNISELTDCGDGSYIMTAAADGEYTLSVSPASSIRAKAEVYTVGDAVRGQTNAKFTGVGGAYVCMVTYTDGTELQSDLIIIKKSDTPSHPIVVGLLFDDVKTADWFYDDVKTAYEAGLMVGTENNKFSPNMGTTRAMATLVLWRLAGCPEPEKSVTFSDVKSGTYYEPAVRWAAENNIVQGIGGGLFAPDALVTREQMSAMLFRHMCYIIESDWTADKDAWEALRKFPDQPSYWAREAMCWAIDKQIILGREGQLAPKESATRAELCAIVMRYIEIDRHLKQIAGL